MAIKLISKQKKAPVQKKSLAKNGPETKPEKVRRNTQKKRKLLRLLSENIGKTGLTKSLYQLMKEAGYSDVTAKQQSEIINPMSEAGDLDPFVKALLKERDAALKLMAKKRPGAKYRDLTDAIDKLTKNANLLSGKPTDRPDNKLSLSDDQFDRLLDQATKRKK